MITPHYSAYFAEDREHGYVNISDAMPKAKPAKLKKVKAKKPKAVEPKAESQPVEVEATDQMTRKRRDRRSTTHEFRKK